MCVFPKHHGFKHLGVQEHRIYSGARDATLKEERDTVAKATFGCNRSYLRKSCVLENIVVLWIVKQIHVCCLISVIGDNLGTVI